jgi:poly [ADP-ribose] polymerase 10/14/15
VSGKQEAVVFFSDNIADERLVKDLSKEGSLFYDSDDDDDDSPIKLSFQLVPHSRTVQLEGLDSSVNKGSIRRYFQVLQQQEHMTQPLLIEDIQTGRPEGTALVTFRTIEGVTSVLQCTELPPISENSPSPKVSLYHTYPPSAVESNAPEERPESPRLETVEPVYYEPEVPDSIDYIWKQEKQKKKLVNQLDCEDLSWDNGILTILGSSYAQEECLKKLKDFSERYQVKTYYVKDSRIWEWSRNFIEAEKENRSSEVEFTALEDELAFKFIGLEAEVNALFHFCADTISAERRKREADSEEVQERLTAASSYHFELLKRSDEFKSAVDTCRVEPVQTGNNVYLDLKGPRTGVRTAKDDFLQFFNGLESIFVELPVPVLRFLRQYDLNPLVEVLNDEKLDAIPTNVEEHSVRLVVKMTVREQVSKIAREAFTTVHLPDVEDNEVQQYLRTEEFGRYLKSVSDDYGVLLELSGEEVEDVEDSPITVSVVGKKAICQEVCTAVSDTLIETVIYTRHIAIEHPGSFRYVKRYSQTSIEEVAARLSKYKTSIEIRRRRASDPYPSVVFSCTKRGLNEVQNKIEKYTTLSRLDKTFSEHGLMRYFNTDSFATKRSSTEKDHQVVIYLDFEDEDDSVNEVPATKMTSLKLPTDPAKIAEFTMRKDPNRMIAIFAGDICHHKADAIVNAANERLEHTGGVALQISRAAGAIMQKESDDYIKSHGKLKEGKAMKTSAGNISNAKHIIHTVGPQWPGIFHLPGAYKKAEEKLGEATKSCLELAHEHGCTSVCFPAIGTGMYRCPSEVVAKSMVKAASNYLAQTKASTVKQVHFILRFEDRENIRCFQKECEATLGPSNAVESKESWTMRVPGIALHEFVGPPRSSPDKEFKPPRASESKVAVASESSAPAYAITRNLSPAKEHLKVSVVPGDITEAKVDVIVNSTNGKLELESAPASKAVLKVAGPQLQADCSDHVKVKGNLNTGDLITTNAYRLPCKKVIHVVCPNSLKGLEDLVVKCLTEVNRLGHRSVAFPALGTGNLGMADEVAAKGILGGIDSYSARGPSNVVDVNVVIFDKDKLPKFHEIYKKQSANIPSGTVPSVTIPSVTVPSPAVIQDNSYQFSNGVILTVTQGDVTKDNSDVIVAPAGVVLGTVFKVDSTVNDDFKTRYKSTANPVADLTGSSKLGCKRVFAIVVPSKGKRDDNESVKCIRDVVSRCLDLANSGKYSSISVPAIGTGGLGYTNVQVAAGIIEASKDFSSTTTSPTLKQIKVKVFDDHRVPDFLKELKSRTAGLRAGMMHSVASGIYSGIPETLKSIYSSAVGYTATPDTDKPHETKSKKKRKKKKKATPLQGFSVGQPDVLTVSVIGSTDRKCEDVMGILQKSIKDACTTYSSEEYIPDGLETARLHELALANKVALKLDVSKGSTSPASITLSGYSEDVLKASRDYLCLTTNAWREEKEASERDHILETCTWCWQDDDETYQSYDEDSIVKLEIAHESGEKSVSVNYRGATVEVDLAKLEMKYEGKSRKVKRQDKGATPQFPSTWKDSSTEGTHDYELEKVQLATSDHEYKDVEQLFFQTGGKGTILSIIRVQNPKLYMSYVQEKQSITKKRQKQIQDGSAVVERSLFHGTKSDFVDHIMSSGFNRSYAGSVVGK